MNKYQALLLLLFLFLFISLPHQVSISHLAHIIQRIIVIMVHTLRSVGDMVWEVNPGRNYKKPDVIGRWIVEWASVTTSFKMESLVGMESKEVGKK